MKKLNFKLEDLKLNKLDLVKGCATDINGNGLDDDDYNNDGYVDQDDQDYYDGYQNGYIGTGMPDDDDPESYHIGYGDGANDYHEDEQYGDGPWGGYEGPNPNPGPDIDGENFNAPTDEEGNPRY